MHRRGQHPPSAAFLISPTVVTTSRFTYADTRRNTPVAIHVSRLKCSAASSTPSPPTTSWSRVATAQASVCRTGKDQCRYFERDPLHHDRRSENNGVEPLSAQSTLGLR